MNVASMRADLNKLVGDEDEKRKEHESAIQEATIEYVSPQAEKKNWAVIWP